MKLKFVFTTLALAALIAPLRAGAINFDDQATSGGAVQLSNQYASNGVLFTDLFAAQNFKFNIFPPSTPNYASPFWVDFNPGLIMFVDPSNASVNATVDTVSFTLVGLTATAQNPGNYSGATVDAIDLNGNVILGAVDNDSGHQHDVRESDLHFHGCHPRTGVHAHSWHDGRASHRRSRDRYRDTSSRTILIWIARCRDRVVVAAGNSPSLTRLQYGPSSGVSETLPIIRHIRPRRQSWAHWRPPKARGSLRVVG
jgi:hypothetical protein